MPSLIEYIRSSRAELEKVSWPSREDTLRYGGLVIGASVLIAVFFGALDFALQGGIKATLEARSKRALPAATQAGAATPEAAPTPELQTASPSEVQAVDSSGKPANVKVETLPKP